MKITKTIDIWYDVAPEYVDALRKAADQLEQTGKTRLLLSNVTVEFNVDVLGGGGGQAGVGTFGGANGGGGGEPHEKRSTVLGPTLVIPKAAKNGICEISFAGRASGGGGGGGGPLSADVSQGATGHAASNSNLTVAGEWRPIGGKGNGD